MGQVQSALTSGMKGVMREQMERTMEFQQEAFQQQMERQLVMQNEMRERQMSMGLARARQIFNYYACFYSLVLIGGTVAALKHGKPQALVPAVPLGFVCAFQYDAAYGTLMERCRNEAERIRVDERDRLLLPDGMPTYQLIESKRKAL